MKRTLPTSTTTTRKNLPLLGMHKGAPEGFAFCCGCGKKTADPTFDENPDNVEATKCDRCGDLVCIACFPRNKIRTEEYRSLLCPNCANDTSVSFYDLVWAEDLLPSDDDDLENNEEETPTKKAKSEEEK